MNKSVITLNFSRNAASYENYAAVQKRCAEQLLEFIRGRFFSRILEIGCGTGTYTRLLRDEYRTAEIVAVDISESMVKIAKKKVPAGNICFVVADGERMELNDRFGLITSNVSFQWFDSLAATLGRFAGNLVPRGVLCFSMYGPETFRELGEVLVTRFGQGHLLSSSRFASRDHVEAILGKYFGKFRLMEERFTVDFLSFWDLLRNIKYSGSRGEGLNGRIFFGKNTIAEMERIYIKKFGKVSATHHIYFCVAEANG